MSDLNQSRSTNVQVPSIYEFLESIVEAIRPTETSDDSESTNIDTSIKPGGYSEDIFIFLSDKERDDYSCCICYNILKEANQCRNGHKYCYNCIYVWSTCERDSADCCPACRCDGQYAKNEQVIDRLNRKRVKCLEKNCNWRGFLLDYDSHEHRNYKNIEFKSNIEYPSVQKPTSTNSVSSIGASNIMDTASGSSVTTSLLRPTTNNNLLSNSSSNLNKNTNNDRISSGNATGSNSRLPNLSRYSASNSTLPPINNHQTSFSSLSTNFEPPTDFRRLAPTYTDRRRRQVSVGTEHLAMLLFALTSEIEDNRFVGPVSNVPDTPTSTRSSHFGPSLRSRSVSNNGDSSILSASSSTTGPNQSYTRRSFLTRNNDTPIPSEETEVASSNVANSSTTSSTNYGATVRPRLFNRSRLNEFHTINRRLTEVSNSLDRLSQQIAVSSNQTSSPIPDDNYDSDLDV